MIPLSRVRLSPRKGGYMGVALHFFLPFFGPKIGPGVPQEPVLQHGQHKKKLLFLCPIMMVIKKLEDVSKKMISVQKTAFLASKRALLGNRGHKTARRAAKWAPTGKPKVSKVASGYGEVMIPLSRVRLSPKMGGSMGVA